MEGWPAARVANDLRLCMHRRKRGSQPGSFTTREMYTTFSPRSIPEFQNWELGLSVWKKVGSSLSSKLSLEIPTLCIICLISKPSALAFSKRIVNTSSIAQDTNLLSFTLREEISDQTKPIKLSHLLVVGSDHV